ncbi:MAG: DUF4349 domain-containing protein [Acidimicrobiia bacterium]|nr:DUF4349 domain-containing protein [Acidimicrobiia bacterium]
MNENRLKLILLAVVVALVASACGGDDDSTQGLEPATVEQTGADIGSPEFALGDGGAERSASDDAATESPEADPLGSGALTVQANPIDLGRDIIYTASIAVEVNDVVEATREASRIMQRFGGLLFGQETTGGTDPRTVLVFRVLPEDFSEALDALGSIGKVRNQQVSADDVTERVVDLESRINTAEASVERLRTLLENATNINDIADLENQLLQRETNLETLRGQLRTIQDRVDLATITLTITEAIIRPSIDVSVSAYPGAADAGLSCPGSTNLVVDEGTLTTACFEIRNSGDVRLTDIELVDPVLEIELDDLTPVFLQPEEILEPGQSSIYYLELTADQTLRLQTRASAIAIDEEGQPLEGRGVADTATATLQAVDPGGLPTFRDGLEASWEAVVTLGELLVLAIGALIPFVWVLPIVWLVRRRRTTTPSVVTRSDEEPETEPELVDA